MVSTQWHSNPSAQRQSWVFPSAQRQSWASPFWCFHSASFFPSSFMVTPWLLITLPSWMGPGRTAAIWGFQKAPPPAKVVTMFQRTILVVSKFKLLTEVVTTNTYHLSSTIWSGETMGLVNSTTNVVAEAGWVVASIGLASWPVDSSSIWSLVERTVVSPLSGGGPNDNGVEPHVSQTPTGFDSMLLMPVVVGWATGSYFLGQFFPSPGWCLVWRRWHAPSHFPLVLGCSSPRGRNPDWLAGRISLPNTVTLRCKPQSGEKAAVKHPDRTGHWGETNSWWGPWGQGAQCTLDLGRPCV